MRKQLVALVLTPILVISSAQAADAVRWEDLPKKIGNGKAREYTIVTKDGNTRKGQRLNFFPKVVSLDYKSYIPREDIAEFRIHHHQEMSEAALGPCGKLFGPIEWVVYIPPMALVMGATCIAMEPPATVVEAVRRLLPDKVIKVAP